MNPRVVIAAVLAAGSAGMVGWPSASLSGEPQTAELIGPLHYEGLRSMSYPESALAASVEGVVVIRVRVNKEGAVTSAKSLAGPPALAPAAVANARLYGARPGASGIRMLVYEFEIAAGPCGGASRSFFRSKYGNAMAKITGCHMP